MAFRWIGHFFWLVEKLVVMDVVNHLLEWSYSYVYTWVIVIMSNANYVSIGLIGLNGWIYMWYLWNGTLVSPGLAFYSNCQSGCLG